VAKVTITTKKQSDWFRERYNIVLTILSGLVKWIFHVVAAERTCVVGLLIHICQAPEKNQHGEDSHFKYNNITNNRQQL